MQHIPPFWESMDFWVAFLVAMVSGGGLGGIITALKQMVRRVAHADP